MNKLKYYRLKHNLTISELCKLTVGSSNRNNVVKHEKGKITTSKAALKYAAVLNENVFDILGDDVLLILPKTQEDKEKLLKTINEIKVDD